MEIHLEDQKKEADGLCEAPVHRGNHILSNMNA